MSYPYNGTPTEKVIAAAREVREAFNAMRDFQQSGTGNIALIKEQVEEAEFHLRDALVTYDFHRDHPELFPVQEVI